MVGTTGATFTGKATPNSTVKITDATGAAIGTTSTDATGAFTVTLALPEGAANLTFTSGTKSAVWSGLVINDTAPLVVTSPTPGSTVVGAGVEFSGTAEPGATITVKDANGTVVGTTEALGDGSYTLTVVLPEGSTSASVNTESRTVVIDDLKVAAKLEVTSPKAGDKVVGPDVTFDGTGQPGDKVVIKDADGTTIGETTVNPDGSWDVTVPLPEGGSVTVESGDQKVTIDDIVVGAPLDVTSPKAGDKVVGPDVTFDGTGQPGETVVIKDADGTTIGETTVNPDGSWDVTVPLPEGGSVTVESGDQKVTIDDIVVAAPLDVTSPKAGDKVVGPDVTFDGTGQPGDKVVIKDADGTTIGETTVNPDGSWDVTVPLPEGGSVTVESGDQKVTIDDIVVAAPLDVTSPKAGDKVVGPDVTFEGSGEPGDKVVIKDADGKTIGETTVNPDGSWNTTVPLPGGGSVTIESGDQTVTIDDLNVVAKLEVTTPKADATIGTNGAEFTGTGQAGETVVITDKDGTVLGETTVGDNGEWTTSVKVPEGSAPITVTAGGQSVVLDGLKVVDDTPKVADFVVVTPNLSQDSGNIKNGTTFTGTGEPGTTVVLTDQDGNTVGQAEIDSEGNWSTTVTGLPQGPNNLTADLTLPGGEQKVIDLGAIVVVMADEATPLMDPAIAGGAALALLAAAGSVLLVRRRRTASTN
nr:Ig-like domain-containing protein [Leifsonia naganoensis]